MSYRIEFHRWLDSKLSCKETRRTSGRHRDYRIIDPMSDKYSLPRIIIWIDSIWFDLIKESSWKTDNPSDLLWWSPEYVVWHDRSLAESEEKDILWRDIVFRLHFIDTCDDLSKSNLDILSRIYGVPAREINWIPRKTILSEYEWSAKWYYDDIISEFLLQGKEISLIRSYSMEHNETLGSGGDIFRNMWKKNHSTNG